MARWRTVDAAIWQHPFFRRQPAYVRDVFLFLLSCLADDEGRFVSDPFAICDGAFSGAHGVTEAEVVGAMHSLEEGGHVLLYGKGKQYGFLTGWFEHQYVRSEVREPSSIPPPDVTVNSWAEADRVREAYAQAVGVTGKRASYHAALRWLVQQEYTNGGESAQILHKTCANSAIGREGKGSRKGSRSTSLTPGAIIDTDDVTSSDKTLPLTAKERRLAWLKEEEELWGEFSDEETVWVKKYIGCADAELKKGTTLQGRVARLNDLVDAANLLDDSEAFLYGLRQACTHQAPNINYVKAAARGWLDKHG